VDCLFKLFEPTDLLQTLKLRFEQVDYFSIWTDTMSVAAKSQVDDDISLRESLELLVNRGLAA
jgi:hypothetical protein